MHKNFQKIIFIFLVVPALFLQNTVSVFAMTANDSGSYVQYNGLYGYGTNMGYYGEQFKDQDVAQLSYNAGARTIRLSLPDWLITGYGANARTPAFQFYQNLGMKDLVAFVGEPNDGKNYSGTGPDNRETITFPGADERARTFKGLYEPVWLDAGKTQINPANTFAAYLYKTVQTYGDTVKFWEIINEPDFTYGSNGWADSSQASSWWNVNPTPNELSNMKAPIFYYVRELRVAYDVIKTVRPNDYVATGGIGYASFLDAMMRNTDNPVDGSVTPQYPLKGGAYFDVLSFHVYPMYSLRHWSNDIMDFVYTRHSDAAADFFLKSKTDFENVLNKYGYNGTTYPKKQWISTETDLAQATVGDTWGAMESANNYLLKVHILAQANDVKQIYKYGLGENGKSNDSFDTTGLYGNITPSTTTISNAPRKEQFKVNKTLSDLLYGKSYDAAKTAQLGLPANIRGAAFKGSDGIETYVLWAKTTIDKSETASATYTFPFAFSGIRREWDYSATNKTSNASQQVTLTGTPSYFTETTATGSNTTTNNNTPPPLVPTYTTPNSSTYQAGPVYNYNSTNNYNPSYTPVYPVNTTTPTPVYQQPSTNITFGKVSVIARKLNVRATPNGILLTQVPYGTRAIMIDNAKVNGVTWTKVIFNNGLVGWISARYMKAI